MTAREPRWRLVTASTVKDTLANVERFVDGNLAGGADHLVLFLDAPDDPATPDVRGFLDAHPHVTCVVTDDTWWTDKRPEQLNTRQRINANVVKALLTTVDWAAWVFHVDGDEIVQLDRTVLDGVPASRAVVSLAPLEAVSRKSWDGDPTWFKRLLELRRPDAPQDPGRPRPALQRSATSTATSRASPASGRPRTSG